MLPPKQDFVHWAVVGAGPAGIAVVGKLLDQGISSKDILWIDPYFQVGDLGRLWSSVSSNTKVKLFLDFLNACSSFQYSKAPDFQINHLPKEATCLLKEMVDPLQWVTEGLIQQVKTAKTIIRTMQLSHRIWTLNSLGQTFRAKNVVLALGAVPTALNYPGIMPIAFEDAIDKERLHAQINSQDTIAVFGSSHSAMIIIRHLVELGVKQVINFYRSPCRYATDMGDWILFDNSGLKGQTADWARQYIDGVWPKNLTRYASTEPYLQRHLPECNKVIYAVGFKQRQDIILGAYEHMDYNPHVGIIGPGLFGLGIAYPEKKQDPFGSVEMQVGLWKFMLYLNKIFPVWLKYTT